MAQFHWKQGTKEVSIHDLTRANKGSSMIVVGNTCNYGKHGIFIQYFDDKMHNPAYTVQFVRSLLPELFFEVLLRFSSACSSLVSLLFGLFGYLFCGLLDFFCFQAWFQSKRTSTVWIYIYGGIPIVSLVACVTFSPVSIPLARVCPTFRLTWYYLN